MHSNVPRNMQMMREEIQELGLDDDAVMKSSRALRRLNNYETRAFPRAGNEAESQKKHSEFSLDDLRKELREDIDAAIRENFETFGRKFIMFSEQLERSKHEIISVIREGPYEKIKDPVRTTRLMLDREDTQTDIHAKLGHATNLEGNGQCFTPLPALDVPNHTCHRTGDAM